MTDLEQRLRNKINALENQNKVFMERLYRFRDATLWERLLMAWRGEL